MYTDVHAVWQKRDGEVWTDVESTWDQRRHYQLFAVLAGVCNGRGFAGVKTGEAVKPIAEPRGIPDGFTIDDDGTHVLSSIEAMPEWQRKYQDEGDLSQWLGDHSHSWLTSTEMLTYAAKAPVAKQCGVIPRAEFMAWDGKRPESYCGDVSGPGVNVIGADANVYREPAMRDPSWTHVRVFWDSSLCEELKYFFDEVQRLHDAHGEVRLVFGFNS